MENNNIDASFMNDFIKFMGIFYDSLLPVELRQHDRVDELNPSSDKFDEERFYKMSVAAADFVDMLKKAEAIPIKDSEAKEAFNSMLEKAKSDIIPILTTFQMDTRDIEEIRKSLDSYRALEIFVASELKKPEYNGLNYNEIDRLSRDENGDIIPGSLSDLLFLRIHSEVKNYCTPATSIKRAEQIEMPVDKLNSNIWNLLEQDTGGQIMIAMEKRGSKKEITLLYSIDFDETLREGIQITKRLTPFDKRVYIAVNALFNAGNNVITLTQIYYAMGYKGKPGTTDLQKIQSSVLKMQGAQISVDNAQEAATYKKYGKFVYNGSLLPLETAAHYNVNGALTDAAIHIFREPPLISFAKQRNQITTVEIKLLQSPINKTDNNLVIDDYLIERISRMKNSKGKSSNKILFNTIFDNAHITAAKQKQRSKETIKRYLDHYKQCGFIKGYKETADGVTIIY